MASDDEKADSSCPTVEIPAASSCTSGRFTPTRKSGCIASYACASGPSTVEHFACTTDWELDGAIHSFELDLRDPETTGVEMTFADEDNPAIVTSPADSVLGMLADQSDGYLEHLGRGLKIYSNSIDIQYTTAFLYASTDFKTGWVRVEDPGDYGAGNHWARVTCARSPAN